MNPGRIQARFDTLRAAQRAALIPYLTAGDPDPAVTASLLHTLVAAGADILELGVPFSDPMADGPVIQRACERALARGTSLTRVLEIVREFRRQDADTPLVLMGYMNPVEAFGLERFALEARSSGVDGVLLVDLAVEEAEANAAVLRAAQLDVIFLAAPTTDDARLAAIARAASGYLYYVSLKGITGAGHLDVAQVADKLAQIRRHSALPIAVGFGVRDAQTAAAVGEVADGVVVGSALVAEVEKHGGDLPALHAALGARLSAMRAALAVRCAEAVAS